jgi:ubiquitin related modifier 1
MKSTLHVLKGFYSGGLEMLFSDQRKHKISLPTEDEQKQPSNVAFLIRWLCDHLMKDPRKEMFVLDDSV